MVMIQLGREVGNLGEGRMMVESIGFLRGATIQNMSRGDTAPEVTLHPRCREIRVESTDAGSWGAQGGETDLLVPVFSCK